MQIGVIGLGRMGGNITRRLMRNGHQAVVYDHDAKAVAALGRDGATGAARLGQAGGATAPAAPGLGDAAGRQDHRGHHRASSRNLLQAGDIVIDGGNTFWQDDIRRAKMLKDARHPSCRRRHQRRRLGTRARLLHDDRRRQGDRRPARSDLQGAGARSRQRAAHARPRRPRSARRARLHPCRTERRRAFRQDGAQRHRIRPDAGLRRRLRHFEATPTATPCRKTRVSISISPTSPKCGGAAASSARGCSI